MTVLTLFDLVIRSMRKNIKHYYLYFFALIFSVVLYFVFATLQHDPAVIARSGGRMGSAFMAAGVLLLVIAGIFVVYANAIFLNRRSREIGLYQLIGLTKRTVSRLLIIENVLLGIGALVVGIGVGVLVSRLFLLLLMKLVGFEGFVALTFSGIAVLQTAIVFIVLITLTSLQMLVVVRRNSLLSLFNADQAGEHPKQPKPVQSAILSVLGIALIVFGYWLSGRMLNEWLLINMLAVLFTTILGTYLIFRVTIGWLFYQIRQRKEGHLGLKDSLSLAPLMHRLKGNANSLTIITVLSAMTLTMVAGAYSMYYSAETTARASKPFDMIFLNDETEESFGEEFALELEEEEGIEFNRHKIEVLQTAATFDVSIPYWQETRDSTPMVVVLSGDQLHAAGQNVEIPGNDTAVFYEPSLYYELNHNELPATLTVIENGQETPLQVTSVENGAVMDSIVGFRQVIVNQQTFEQLKERMRQGAEGAWNPVVDTFQVPDKEQRIKASEIFQQEKYRSGDFGYISDYVTYYGSIMETNGLLIFIAGFLGLVFLISTGSILYFKQMTEAEQEKQSYATLRQLGFTVQDIMRGIMRKQLFVFGIPLLLGLLHSIFAIKAASFLFMTDVTVPTTIAMSVYAIIYFVFAFLTIGYYRKTVKAAL